MLTQQRLQELLHYDPVTGEFTRLVTRRRYKAGTIPGCVVNDGYRRIQIDDTLYSAHRLAWLYVHGTWPVEHLDHINGIRDDNRIANLRECSRAENCQNRIKQANNTSGYMGVSWDKRRKKWLAHIKKDGKQQYLGLFDDPAIAHQAYLDAKARLHTFNPIPR